ncbi:sugar ABC transporter ATP-binding protein [Microbacterium sp. LWS13-1.2]|uniref:Sugar ABC transporter ATP-binding protein n=1 Tax=Microbacterium sp. LWS13-1.2 TaxID=3135264 RepID=A0AAU6S8S4_9MICO
MTPSSESALSRRPKAGIADHGIADHGIPAPLIEVRNLVKRFPGVVAVANASLTISAGDIVALTGENGSGKSTLSKIIGGVEQPDEGSILVDGIELKIVNPHMALGLGIVMISQELTLAQTLTVTENVLLGRLPRGRGGLIDWRTARRRAREVLDELGVHIDVDTLVRDLSVELQQEVEIARAISSKARLLILDEATSSLSEKATDRLLSIVRELARRGVAVLMISHRMPELYSTAHRATVLRDGRVVGTVDLPETPERQLVTMMVGRELGDYYGSRTSSIGSTVLSVSGLRQSDGELKPTELVVRSGEILGIAGLVGSGKAELAMALGGAIAAQGTVTVNGVVVKLGDPRSVMRTGIGYVPDDRRRAALLPVRSVAENMTIAWRESIASLGVIRSRVERDKVKSAISRYGVKTSSADQRIALLSGGNQQKAILGRTFARNCPVYVLNEPTRGVDVGSKSAIYAFLQQLATEGAAIVLISSELPELIGLADRIGVFFHGEVAGELSGTDISEEALGALAVSGHLHSSTK